MSTSLPDGVPHAAQPWWVRSCRLGWKVIYYFWATFFLTLVLPKVVEVLFSDKPLRSFPNLWPLLEAIVSHPTWTLLIFLGLLLLTGLFWLGSHKRMTTTPRALSEHERVHMLRRLRLRYEQMLTQSLQGAVQLELGLVSSPAAIQNAASLSLHLPHQLEQPLPPHTSIREAYELAQQELLILGEPGAGKSTLLLELAHHLVEKAEQDAEQPLPVLLPLSSWATTHPPLQEWLSEQVALLYDVPQSLSQHWIQAEQLLPLLDGLDEMEASQRPDCIVAINTYHRGHLQPLVVCSRTNEYETAATHEQLALHTAVVVQPLSAKQVDTYLANMGRPLTALRTALQKNDMLRELATTPLMVQILILTYHDTPVRKLSQKEAQLQAQIWDDYVQRMVKRKGDAERYPLNQTVAWLSWLAQQMRQRGQTIFYLERLQPDWLPKRQHAFYRWSIVLLGGLVGGLVFGLGFGLRIGLVDGLVFGLVGGLVFGLGIGLGVRLATIDPVKKFAWSWKECGKRWGVGLVGGLAIGLGAGLVVGLRAGLARGLGFGLSFGLAIGLSIGLATIDPVKKFAWSWKERGKRWSVGLVFGLGFGLVVGLVFGLSFGLAAGLSSGLGFGLAAGLGFGLAAGMDFGLVFGLGFGLGFGLADIDPVEKFAWSWKGSGKGLGVGLSIGLVGGLTIGLGVGLARGLGVGLVSGLGGGLISGLVFGLVGGLGGGLSGEQLTERSILSPNEGIRRSINHGLLIGLVGGLGGLFVGLVFRPVGELGGGLFGGLVGGLVGGLDAAIYHCMLRFWLWYTHSFPWKAVSFLEDATARILLRRIGGGYTFVHRLLLDHFADLNTERALDSAAPSSVPSHPPSTTTPSA